MTAVKLITQSDDLQAICKQMQPDNWAADNEMTSYTVEGLKNFLKDPTNILLLAYDDHLVAGVALAYEMTHPVGVNYLYLHELDTHPDYRRKGIGTLLMNELRSIGKARGCKEMWLEVDDDNPGAQKLYDSLSPTDIEKTITYSYNL